MQPRQAFFRKDVPCRPQSLGFVESADREMRLARQARALASQCRPAFGAEPARRPAGRRLEFADRAFGDAIRRALEIDEDRNRRAAVLPAALAMAPVNALRRARSDKADRTAQAAAVELLASIAHDP